jgi:MFS transporter, ACS family, allantoate permease
MVQSREIKDIDLEVSKSEANGELVNLGHSADDVAAQFLATLDQSVVEQPITPAEERKVLWKIDLSVLPLIGLSVILSAVDKNILSNAAIFGMKDDTHLSGNDYSCVGSLFFLGYLVFEWPMAYAIQKFPVAKFFASTVLGWGALAMCTAATHNFAGLATVRFFSAFLPLLYPMEAMMC